MKLYIIFWSITNIAFIAAAIFVTCWFNNLSLLWLLTIPTVMQFFGLSIKETTKVSKDDEQQPKEQDSTIIKK
ncbi:MAG: hypothetical protein NC218_02225 [Acetobacter sp.]|nr:hypothetical protein [Acetobacter sp.]